jgi:hypothetical protein
MISRSQRNVHNDRCQVEITESALSLASLYGRAANLAAVGCMGGPDVIGSFRATRSGQQAPAVNPLQVNIDDCFGEACQA